MHFIHVPHVMVSAPPRGFVQQFRAVNSLGTLSNVAVFQECSGEIAAHGKQTARFDTGGAQACRGTTSTGDRTSYVKT